MTHRLIAPAAVSSGGACWRRQAVSVMSPLPDEAEPEFEPKRQTQQTASKSEQTDPRRPQ